MFTGGPNPEIKIFSHTCMQYVHVYKTPSITRKTGMKFSQQVIFGDDKSVL